MNSPIRWEPDDTGTEEQEAKEQIKEMPAAADPVEAAERGLVAHTFNARRVGTGRQIPGSQGQRVPGQYYKVRPYPQKNETARD